MGETATAPDDLRMWRDANGISTRELGRRLGLSHSTIVLWENRKKTPGREYREVIQRLTRGKVKACRWALTRQELIAQAKLSDGARYRSTTATVSRDGDVRK